MPTSWIRLYARGFLLSPDSVAFMDDLEHFQRHELSGAVLYADDITEIGIATAGNDWVVTLGKLLPLSTGLIQSVGSDIAEELMARLLRDGLPGLEAALYDLGGRHAVLVNLGGQIYAYNDAAGHRTVYFNPAQQRIGSHFDMLHRLSAVSELSCPVGSQNYDAHPEGLWDVTENPHIRALLPNHRLHLQHGVQQRFALMTANPYTHLPWRERLELIHQFWHEQLDHVFASSPSSPVGLSLSGGLDSRTMLAHMRPYLKRTRAFTYTSLNVHDGSEPETFWEKTVTTDHNVLAQMHDLLPEDFHVIHRAPGRNLTQDQDEIMRRNTMRNHGRNLVKLYRELFCDINSIHLRGNLVELGRLIRGQLHIEGQRQRLAPIIQAVGRRRKPDMKAYRKFFWDKVDQFQYDDVHSDFEYTDVYHWENRSSRWYAEVANETDTVFDSIVPVNVRRIYELLISPPVCVRPTAQLQRDLIHHAWPELLAYGINTEDDLYTTGLRNQLGELT
ncbi:hypothetical protein [Enteractinococcus helveticum]|uniref:Asparagine synthetase domain-containing protein n=1 Tax=Enteractinococcus helveticum TaxID=1837282 RepID=A0A1B7M3F0_9MICC|nr:hypothetical protein [Enteractinococcus helveticum]OAV63117.1 hypothetical protein A6F49_02885 [Enteractinococcus helveticum]